MNYGLHILMDLQTHELWAQIIDGSANMNYGLQMLMGLQT